MVTRDTTMTLPDGRVLAYTDLGAPNGPLVMYFHGAPTSRLDLVGFDDTFAELNVRVVCPDRPGYGGSSPQPGRHWRDWPADVAALADHLGVERFAVTGISSGGPYAVVCAALLPDRIVSGAVVAGVTDFSWPDAWDGFFENEAALMRVGDEIKARTWCELHYGVDGSGFAASFPELAPADHALLADDAAAQAFTNTIAQAFRQGVSGYAQDITVQSRPWSFDPGDIIAPVRVIHGEADTLVPVAHALHNTELIPHATLSLLPEHGHVSMLGLLPQIIADLTTTTP
jgi:pimeloyl-ACP methyl ester carboxylesterase